MKLKRFGWTILLVMPLVLNACCSVPPYSPAYWNDGGVVQGNNNCYNYGNNKRTDTYAQPGKASGISLAKSDMECTKVRNAAVADGIELLPASGICPKSKNSETCKVALVVRPYATYGNYADYHWYRLDSNGMWSHKPGQTQATNLDNSNHTITNPETANRGSYTDFCGYLCSCSDNVQGQGHENIK